ncbi:MAG: CinA family nicotinamide mononucleotide deamidase-related protein [Lentisphaeria bacterium]|nr:CinA family nicotinamide mononucleotide deamidase-related protein [Lentisphaeria bacterium]
MRIEAICIGTELLSGDTLNTNLAFLGEALAQVGCELSREVCIPDTLSEMETELREALSRADIVLVVGGLGPTRDDLTRIAASHVLEKTLVESKAVRETIEAYLEKRRHSIPDTAVQAQSMVLEGVDILPNLNGTAPGQWCDVEYGSLAMLPGPPHEFGTMVIDQIVPRILAKVSARRCTTAILTTGIGESQVARQVDDVMQLFPGVDVGYCAKPFGVAVRLISDCEVHLREAEDAVRETLGAHALPPGTSGLPEEIGRLLLEAGLCLATAESCTGGGIAAAITDVPGASAYFHGAVVTYSNSWKMKLLDVSRETLETAGAVSDRTVDEMLDGVLGLPGVSAAVAVSGVAGPGGGTPEKPCGLVYIGAAVEERRKIRELQFPGNRDTVRIRTTATALGMLRDLLVQLAVERGHKTMQPNWNQHSK